MSYPQLTYLFTIFPADFFHCDPVWLAAINAFLAVDGFAFRDMYTAKTAGQHGCWGVSERRWCF